MTIEPEISDHAFWLAVEHCRWARDEGMTVRDVIDSVGGRFTVPQWPYAVSEVQRAWLDMHGYEHDYYSRSLALARDALNSTEMRS